MNDKINARKEELTELLTLTRENLEENKRTLIALQKAISDDEMRELAITNRLDEIELLTAQ
mgnify:CR=1 FL=1